jgi:hypothetical protein
VPRSHHHGISAGAGAAIGVVVTLLIIAGCLTAYYFLYHRRKQSKKNIEKDTIEAVNARPEEGPTKPELDGKTLASTTAQALPPQYEMQANPTPAIPRTELAVSSLQHELAGNTGQVTATIPHELYTQSPPGIPNSEPRLPSIRRKEVQRVVSGGLNGTQI